MADTDTAFRLDGQVALVTGAGRGLGAAIARALAEAGAAVMLSDVDADAVQRSAGELAADGLVAEGLVQDVVDEAAWPAVIDETLAHFGGLDIVVNNAGIEVVAPLIATELRDFQRMMDVNVTGVFLGIKHAVQAMMPGGRAGKGGSIVNLSSVAGLIGVAGLGGYCASKGAVRLLSKAAAVECAAMQTGIRVNSIHPAIIKTDMGANVLRGMAAAGLAPDEDAAEAAIGAIHPMGYGTPEDVARAVVYLCSDAGRWSNGTEHVLDGGASAQ